MIKYIGEQREFSTDCGIELSTVEEVLDFLNQIEYIGCDTETTGFDPHTKGLLSLQLGNKQTQFVINCLIQDITPFKELLESKTILFHNAKFDMKFLYKYGIDVRNIYDSFLSECILTTGYEKEDKDLSLKGVAKKYLNVDLDKTIRGNIHKLGMANSVIEYAARDIEYLEDIMNAQLIEIDKWNLRKVLDLENKVVRVFTLMEWNGIGFDKEKLKNVASGIDSIRDDLTHQLDDIVVTTANENKALIPYTEVQGDLFTEDIRATTINWASPAQKTEIINKLGFKVESVADKVLQKYKGNHPIFRLLIDYSKHNKLANTFGYPLLKFVNPVTNRIHSNIWQILATARISMEDPPLQQIPSHSSLGQTIKSCFVAKEGYKIVSADISGCELRLIAQYSQDPLWLKIFREGKDLHSELCSLMFNIPIEDVKKPFPGKPDLTYRFVTKTSNFLISYGGSEFKLADTTQLSILEAKKIINKFFKMVPKVETFLNMVAKMGVTNGYIRTSPYYKRIRWFPNLNKNDFKSVGEVERASKNSPFQGSNAEILKQSLIDLQDIIDSNNYPVNILLSVHDEIVTECLESFATEWKLILETTMINAAKILIMDIPVEVEGNISDFWTK